MRGDDELWVFSCCSYSFSTVPGCPELGEMLQTKAGTMISSYHDPDCHLPLKATHSLWGKGRDGFTLEKAGIYSTRLPQRWDLTR